MKHMYFEKYGYAPDKEVMDRSLEIIAKNLPNVMSGDVMKQCFGAMDLTSLHTNDTPESISKLCEKVNKFRLDYPDYPLPASICVYPNFASIVAERRNFKEVHVTTVAGCFPTSQSFLPVKEKECEMAIAAGAEEIDIVLALNSFMAGDIRAAGDEIRAMHDCVERAGKEHGKEHVIFKVILETGLLVAPESIAIASFLAMENGADFIKTSTGKVDVNATPAAAFVMCQCIKAYHEKTGRKVGFKAAGGISSAMDAICYYQIVSTVLGKEWLGKDCFRLGVSRLANNLLSAIEQKTINYF